MATVKLVPVPVDQLVPLLMEYCQVALVSNPVIEKVLLAVTKSVLLIPESIGRTKVRAEGAVASSV